MFCRYLEVYPCLMNSLFRSSIVSRSAIFIARKPSWIRNFDEVKVSHRTINFTRFHLFQPYSTVKKARARSNKSAPKPPLIGSEEKEKNAFFLVRKGDIIGVYKNLSDCQAQVGSSICSTPASIYKGYSLAKSTEDYLLSCGLQNALYTLRAVDLKEELFGTLTPCPFQLPSSLLSKFQSGIVSDDSDLLEAKTGSSCIIAFDGACKGNPGPSGAGVVVRSDDGNIICKLRSGLGIKTNNAAEYEAMILGMRYAAEKGYTSLSVFGDSKLVCMQIQGLWKVRNENLSILYKEAKVLKEKFKSFKIAHVLRNLNSEADAQANLGVLLADGQVIEEI